MINEALFTGICAAMDALVLVREADQKFRLMNQPPEHQQKFLRSNSFLSSISLTGDRIALQGRDAFMDNFLIDADLHWSKMEPGRLESGPWIVHDESGEEQAFELIAIYHQHNCILVLQHLGESYLQQVHILQHVRNKMLDNEVLEAEVRKRTMQVRMREEEIAIRLLTVAGCRNEETGSHLKRIGLYSAAMARELGWKQKEIDEMRIAAPMHDVGKIGIPDNVILKPGKLTPEEFEIMKSHATIGDQLLQGSNIDLLERAREIAVAHHEKWDGSGYPAQLCGEEIPISARIVAIVDVYDALVHKRVYKKAVPEEETIEYMKSCVGKHFDPELFEVFLRILPELRGIRLHVIEGAEEYDVMDALKTQ